MKKYLDYVVTIINQEGIEDNLPSDKTDTKHISAFKRLMKKNGYDKYNINGYLDNLHSQGQVTGFDISKYISGQGNIVFFHTDVHNQENNKKVASIMLPYDMTNIQSKKLIALIWNLEIDNFSYYIGVTKPNKSGKRVLYNLISKSDQEMIINSIMNNSDTNNLKEGFQHVRK